MKGGQTVCSEVRRTISMLEYINRLTCTSPVNSNHVLNCPAQSYRHSYITMFFTQPKTSSTQNRLVQVMLNRNVCTTATSQAVHVMDNVL